MRKIRVILLAAAVISFIAGYGIRMFLPEIKIDEKAHLKEIAPELTFSEKKAAPPHYLAAGNIVAFNSFDITPSIRGYAGPIKVLVVLSPDGRINGIRVLDHKETKNYVHYMETPEYLGRFIGKSVNDPIEVDRDIDGITKATVSVEALAKTVRDSSRIVASNVLGISVGTTGPHSGIGVGWLWYMLLFSSALVFYFITRISKRFLMSRDLFLGMSIPLTGLYLSSFFSVLHVFNIILLRASSSLLWYVIVISTISSVIVAGRFYCGWLCPFGALSEFIGRLPLKKWNIPVETDNRWRRLKYILLGTIAVIIFVSGRIEFGNYETYITLFSFHGNVMTWSLVVITLLANLKIERFWCRYLCPVAAFTGVLTPNAKGYPGASVCPVGIKKGPFISECIRCNRCYNPKSEVEGK